MLEGVGVSPGVERINRAGTADANGAAAVSTAAIETIWSMLTLVP